MINKEEDMLERGSSPLMLKSIITQENNEKN